MQPEQNISVQPQQNIGADPRGASQGSPAQAQPQQGGDPALQQTLLTRFTQLSEEEAGAFASIVNEETFGVLSKMLPELNALFDKVMSMSQQNSGQQDYIQPQTPQLPQEQSPVTAGGASRGLVG